MKVALLDLLWEPPRDILVGTDSKKKKIDQERVNVWLREEK